VVTGNTVVDALDALLPMARARATEYRPASGRLLVVTVHRREAWGIGVRAVASAVRAILAEVPDLHATVVSHPNPAVAGDVRDVLDGVTRCSLLPPLRYDDMLALLCAADVVLTDSGGIQEEAPSIGVPVVVARAATERPEGVEAGAAVLAGLDEARIIAAVLARLRASGGTPWRVSPYGDGRAGERAADAIAWLLREGARPAAWHPSHPGLSDDAEARGSAA
jgi:UDP-N-acetylglucosamine 2-epimerase (non-hydrolysing)